MHCCVSDYLLPIYVTIIYIQYLQLLLAENIPRFLFSCSNVIDIIALRRFDGNYLLFSFFFFWLVNDKYHEFGRLTALLAIQRKGYKKKKIWKEQSFG